MIHRSKKSSPSYFLELLAVIHFLVFCCPTNRLFAQRQQSSNNHLILGYRYGGFTDEVGSNLRHRERNHLLDAAYWIQDKYAIVGTVNLIRSNFGPFGEDRQSAKVYSLLFRKNFLNSRDYRLYLGLGFSIGNYCTCGDALPRMREKIRYLRYDLGMNFKIVGPLGLSVQFEGNHIVNKIEDKYAYNVISAGLVVSLRK